MQSIFHFLRSGFSLRSLAIVALSVVTFPVSIPAQGDLGACTLKDHVYTCDGAAFQRALSTAKTVSLQTHNADGVARGQLTAFVTKKLGKTIASPDNPADLSFLLMPIDRAGNIDASPGDLDLGTLRVYSVKPDGTPEHLLWAETFAGPLDMPWPAVVRGLILQFRSHFHIQ